MKPDYFPRVVKQRSSRRNERPADPEAKEDIPIIGGVLSSVRGADAVWSEVKGTGADDTLLAVAAFSPGRTIRRCAGKVVVEAIFDPLEDVTDHVIKTETVGSERTHGR